MAGRKVHWRGQQLRASIRRAVKDEVNETGKQAVQHAKQNHEGWVYRSGNAERSIRIQTRATFQGSQCVLTWGSVGIVYFRRLEYEHGHALQNAAAATYPGLPRRIRARLR